MNERIEHDDDARDQQIAEQVGRVADEIAQRVAENQRVDLSEYLAEYPELAEVLPSIFSSVKGLSTWYGEAPEGAETDGSQGLELGDFRLGRELGRGGMGIVYEAEQLSLRRKVAIKVFPFVSVLEPNKLQRFKNEALAAATLEHPHIVPVLAVGVERNTHFYAMRLIKGVSLASVIREFHAAGDDDGSSHNATNSADRITRDSPEEHVATQANAHQSTIHSRSNSERQEYQRRIAAWIRDAAEALHYAHSLGVVHRDIKPSNLLVDEQQKVWVTDFGLATGILDNTLTLTGDLLGTLPYMSPEQTSGNRQFVDHRTDVYSLGVTLYEALTGRKPFVHDNRARLIQEITYKDANFDPGVKRLLSTDLVNVALKAMAKDPTERYATAQDLADDLTRYLTGKTVLARRPSPLNRSIRWMTRNRTVTVATAIVFACLAFAAIQSQISNWHIRRTTQKLKRHLYVADARLASEALEQHNIVQARELLSRHIPADGERDLRGFAWHLLWKRAHPAKHTLVAHDAPIASVDWSPDGKHIASADQSGQVLIWDAARGTVRQRFARWGAAISSIRYSPDGQSLAVIDEGGKLVLVESDSGALLRSVEAHEGVVRSVAFSPTGKRLVTCGEDGTIGVWETSTLSEKFRVRSHGFRAYDVRFCVDETHLASVGPDETIRIWQIGEDQPLKEIAVGVHVRSLAVAPDGREIVCNLGLGELRKYTVPDGDRVGRWEIAPERFYEVHYSPDGRHLIATGKDRLSRLVDARSGKVLRVLAGHTRRIYAASFAPDGSRMVTASADGTCKIFPVKPGETTTVDKLEGHAGINAALSPNGRYLAYEDGKGNLSLRDNRSGETTVLPGNHLGKFLGEFSSTGETFAMSGGPFLSLDASTPTLDRLAEPVSVDLDMDGDMDLLAAVRPHFRLLYQERTDDGQLSEIKLLPLLENRRPQAHIKQIDEQAWDVTTAVNLDGRVRRYLLMQSKIDRFHYYLSRKRCEVALVEDVNNDGDIDIIVDEEGRNHLQLFTAASDMELSQRRLTIRAEDSQCIVTNDIDGDQLNDLVVAQAQHDRVDWYRQTGPMEFEFQGPVAESLKSPNLLIAEDVDEDGHADLITVDDGEVVWLRRSRPEKFEAPQPLTISLHELNCVMPFYANTVLWNTGSHQVEATLPAMCHHPQAMAIASNGRLVATVGDGQQVRLRDCTSGQQIAVISVAIRPKDLSFSPTNELLAIADGDDCILWDIGGNSAIARLRGHESTVEQLRFSPAGDRLATLSRDMTVGLWNPSNGNLKRTLFGFTARPNRACFSPDGQTIAVGTIDGEISLWDVDTGQQLCVVTRFSGHSIEAISFHGARKLLALAYHAGGDAILKSFRVE